MRSKLSLFALILLALTCGLLSAAAAAGKDFKFEAQLIWATTSDKSPDPNHKPADADVRKKLDDLPLKWKSYFLVKRENLSVAPGASKESILSDKCKIAVKDIDGKNFEVALIGQGESVLKRTQKLPKGDMLVLGGNAPDSTGWLVVFKRIE